MATLARRVAARVLPAGAKRAHERWATGRRTAQLQEPTAAYLAAHGPTVRHGPLAGLRYPGDAADGGTDYLVAKLVGAYELELRPAVEDWIAAAPHVVVDVGCAEGYYAVGLAVALPGATVYAYDLDDRARTRCAALAELNGVAGRVEVREACTPASLEEFPAAGTVLLCDCEGYERTLLDPAAAPVLTGWPILVELHDFVDPTITDTITERFRPTHDLALIEEAPRHDVRVPELADLPDAERRVLLDEYRPELMRWAYLTPRSTASVSAA